MKVAENNTAQKRHEIDNDGGGEGVWVLGKLVFLNT